MQTSVYPKVIDCPARGSDRPTLDAVAKDGIQLKVKARVTVRANLERLIGGATEETIIARVGEGIVSAIGSADSHKRVLENPDMISKAVLSRRLDSQTAFEIVSIDIADIDVGDNIGARLQADQAEADTRVARARAEQRRAMATAAEQEQLAQIEKSRASLVEAEAEVPHAMAESFRSGRLGILDYYKLRNVQADTEMRTAIAGTRKRATRSSRAATVTAALTPRNRRTNHAPTGPLTGRRLDSDRDFPVHYFQLAGRPAVQDEPGTATTAGSPATAQTSARPDGRQDPNSVIEPNGRAPNSIAPSRNDRASPLQDEIETFCAGRWDRNPSRPRWLPKSSVRWNRKFACPARSRLAHPEDEAPKESVAEHVARHIATR